jgi:hypothetical protein
VSADDDVMGAVNRRAMDILAEPRELRELLYDTMYKAHFEAALTGMTEAHAKELAQRMDEWIREAVRIIESGGGAAGGRA